MRFLAAVFGTLLLSTNAHAGQIWLTMDQVRPYEIKVPAGQIVVGNPAIADVTVRDKTRLLLFGKSPGLTNIFIFDEEGGTVENLKIRVKTSSSEMLTVHRGAARITYNCTDQCDNTVTVGDDETVFQGTANQANLKFTQASGASDN